MLRMWTSIPPRFPELDIIKTFFLPIIKDNYNRKRSCLGQKTTPRNTLQNQRRIAKKLKTAAMKLNIPNSVSLRRNQRKDSVPQRTTTIQPTKEDPPQIPQYRVITKATIACTESNKSVSLQKAQAFLTISPSDLLFKVRISASLFPK